MRAATMRFLLLAGISVPTLLIAGVANAQTQSVEELVVTGSRAQPRTVLDSPVPIDSYGSEEISSVATPNTMDVLKTLVPSYTVARNSLSDGQTFVRPATLRGLDADKTLLLVNSKRRHRSALVGTFGSGAQSADVAVIPSSALKSVEVLRDGAGAQYGSDAVAGVINFILKDNDSGGSLSAMAGQYYEGDGDTIIVTGNKGFKLGESGFISASFEYTTEQPTSRGRQFCNRNIPFKTPGFCAQVFSTETTAPGSAATAAYAQSVAWDQNLPSVLQKWGQPDGHAIRGFVNAGYTFSNDSELYAFANYSKSLAKEDFNYRPPVDVGSSSSALDNTVRLSDGSLWRGNLLYPRGFTPQFFGDLMDYSLTGGYRGTLFEDLGFDLSARYGRNEITYTISNTLNFSMGPGTPTDFHPGDLIADEMGLNADFTKEVTGWTPAPLYMAFGAEYREEGYEIAPGDVPSYYAGVFSKADPYDFCTDQAVISQRTLRPTAPQNAGIACASPTDPVYQLLGVGSNGFQGYPPLYTGSLNRHSYAAYYDVSTDVTDKLFLQASVRAEKFSDFGSTLDFKVAGRYELTDDLGVRGSIGTGFRAPTPGQQFTSVVSTGISNQGVPVVRGLFPATNPVASFLGAKELEPEKSKSATLGLTANLSSGLKITVDAYYIQVKDLFYAIQPIDVTPAIRAQMLAIGVPGADSIEQINFFQNAFDSDIAGLDVVATYRQDWSNGQTTDLSLSFNYNQKVITEVRPFVDSTGKPGKFFDGEFQYDYKHASPKWRGSLTATHEIGPISIMGRANVFGNYSNLFSATNLALQKWDPTVQFDLEASWKIDEVYTLTIGGRNVFDSYPDPDKIGRFVNGQIYSDGVVDWQGGFYFAKIAAQF